MLDTLPDVGNFTREGSGAPHGTPSNVVVYRREQFEHWGKFDKEKAELENPEYGETLSATEVPANSVVSLKPPLQELPREEVLQEWEGQVQEIGRTYFTATLVDISAGETDEREFVRLPIEDISPGDRALLVEGATFRWIIGYRYRGERERFDRIVIRRLPIWSPNEMRDAEARASEIFKKISASRKNNASDDRDNRLYRAGA